MEYLFQSQKALVLTGLLARAVVLLLSCFSGLFGNVSAGNLQTTVAAGQSYAYWVDGSVARQVLPSSRGVVSCFDTNGA